MDKKFTGWVSTDSENTIQCPTCGAAIGEECRTPSGGITDNTHLARVNKFLKLYGKGYEEKKITF